MPRGPGKYDELASVAMHATGADVVCVIVLGGVKGPGFACQMTSKAYEKDLPRVLREVADAIERDLGGS